MAKDERTMVEGKRRRLQSSHRISNSESLTCEGPKGEVRLAILNHDAKKSLLRPSGGGLTLLSRP